MTQDPLQEGGRGHDPAPHFPWYTFYDRFEPVLPSTDPVMFMFDPTSPGRSSSSSFLWLPSFSTSLSLLPLLVNSNVLKCTVETSLILFLLLSPAKQAGLRVTTLSPSFLAPFLTPLEMDLTVVPDSGTDSTPGLFWLCV